MAVDANVAVSCCQTVYFYPITYAVISRLFLNKEIDCLVNYLEFFGQLVRFSATFACGILSCDAM
jgi:hypothetical protein